MKNCNAQIQPKKIEPNPPRLNINYELYQNYLDTYDHSTEEENKFLDALWTIIINFVDLGFEIHPIQQVYDKKIILDEFNDINNSHILQKQIQSFIETKNKSNSTNHIKHERNL